MSEWWELHACVRHKMEGKRRDGAEVGRLKAAGECIWWRGERDKGRREDR